MGCDHSGVAVGRTQEIVFRIDELSNEGRLPPMPVYGDSPLAVHVTDIFKAHPECYDQSLLDYMKNDPKPFGFSRLTYVRDVEDSKGLNGSRLPMVIISASRWSSWRSPCTGRTTRA